MNSKTQDNLPGLEVGSAMAGSTLDTWSEGSSETPSGSSEGGGGGEGGGWKGGGGEGSSGTTSTSERRPDQASWSGKSMTRVS